MLYFNAFNLVANQPSRNAKISALKFLHEQICFHNRIPLLCWTQVLPRHGKSGGVQLPFLVCAMPNLHHRNNPYKHPVYGIPDGLFSFHAVWGQPSAETGPSFTKAVELSDCLHCLYHHHEKPAFSMYAQCFFFFTWPISRLHCLQEQAWHCLYQSLLCCHVLLRFSSITFST